MCRIPMYDEFILSNYQDKSAHEMADELCIPVSTIRNACSRLGVEPKEKDGKYDAYIKAHFEEESITDMSNILNVDSNVIRYACRRLHITPISHDRKKIPPSKKISLLDSILQRNKEDRPPAIYMQGGSYLTTMLKYS